MKCDLNGKECPIGEKYGACFYCGQASVLYGHLFRSEENILKLPIDKDYAVPKIPVLEADLIHFMEENM